MKYLVTGTEMKLLDYNTSQQFHVPAQVLMEQAAMVFVRELLSYHPKIKQALVVCGTGNNGADGIAIARLLNQSGITCHIFLIGDALQQKPSKESELYQLQKKIYFAYGYPVATGIQESDHYDCVIDAIFGIGLSRSITGQIAQYIHTMNHMNGHKIAVDIASGISADCGAVLETAFLAEDTITFSFGKIGQYLWPGSEYSGNVHIVPMGITVESWLTEEPHRKVFEEKDLSLLPVRTAHSNKGTYGKLLLIAGSTNMAGAAILAGKAAYRMGTGLVRIMTPEENRIPIQTALPEAILTTYGQNLSTDTIAEAIHWADAIVAGPGLGTSPTAKALLSMMLSLADVPLVLDADALNMIAKEKKLFEKLHTPVIVTPHLGEMSRLTGYEVPYIQQHLLETAQEFARKYQTICVLKDMHTITALPSGMCFLNLSGNHGMATAGSGDVLSGIIGGLLAQGTDPAQAAGLGVFVHGLAGDYVREKMGAASLMAGDLCDAICFLTKKTDGDGKNE